MHLAAAVVLMVLLELGVETCIKCVPGVSLSLTAQQAAASLQLRVHMLHFHDLQI